MRIRTYFFMCMSAVTAVAAIAAGLTIVSATRDFSEARRLRSEVEVVGRLLLVPEKLAAERVAVSDIVLGRLEFGDPQRAKVNAMRAAADEAVDAALAAAAAQMAGGPRDETLHETKRGLKAWRDTADTLLAQPGATRDPAQFGRLSAGSAALLGKFDTVFDAGDRAALAGNGTVGDLLMLARAGWALRTSSSGRAIPILKALGSASALGPQALEALAGADAAVGKDWEAVDGLVKRIGSDELQRTIESGKASYRAFEDTYRGLVQAGRAGNAYPMTAAEYGGAFVNSLKSFALVRDAALARAMEVASERLARAQSRLVIACANLLAALAIAIGAAVLLTRRVVFPIIGLTGTVGQIAVSDFGVAVPGQQRPDEIGEMASAIERLRQNLLAAAGAAAERLAEQDRLTHRAATLETLARGFETEAGGLVADVSRAAHELDATARSLATLAKQTEQSARESASAATESSAGVNSVSATAEKLAASIAEISRQVTHSSSITDQAVEDARRANGTVQKLSDGARNIGDIVSLIDRIAGQTNLLALNATIEAARAGEAGKGFAVVASEVKALAAQTAKATGEINTQIGGIQTATRETVDAIQHITATIGQIRTIASGLIEAIGQQGEATSNIALTVADTARRTLFVSETIAGVSQSIAAADAVSADVLSAAETVARKAEGLGGQIGRFVEGVRAA